MNRLYNHWYSKLVINLHIQIKIILHSSLSCWSNLWGSPLHVCFHLLYPLDLVFLQDLHTKKSVWRNSLWGSIQKHEGISLWEFLSMNLYWLAEVYPHVIFIALVPTQLVEFWLGGVDWFRPSRTPLGWFSLLFPAISSLCRSTLLHIRSFCQFLRLFGFDWRNQVKLEFMGIFFGVGLSGNEPSLEVHSAWFPMPLTIPAIFGSLISTAYSLGFFPRPYSSKNGRLSFQSYGNREIILNQYA